MEGGTVGKVRVKKQNIDLRHKYLEFKKVF